jgi:hypothetical protein
MKRFNIVAASLLAVAVTMLALLPVASAVEPTLPTASPYTAFNGILTNSGSLTTGGTNVIVDVTGSSVLSVSVISSNSSATTSNGLVFLEQGNLNTQSSFAWKAIGALPTLAQTGTLGVGASTNLSGFGYKFIRINWSNGTDNAAINTNFLKVLVNK